MLKKEELKRLKHDMKMVCKDGDKTEQDVFISNWLNKYENYNEECCNHFDKIIDKHERTIFYYICETMNSEHMLHVALSLSNNYLSLGGGYTVLDHAIENRNIKHIKCIINYKNGELINENWGKGNTILNILCHANDYHNNFFKLIHKRKLLKLLNLVLSYEITDVNIRNDKDELSLLNLLINKETFYDSDLFLIYNNIILKILEKTIKLNKDEQNKVNKLLSYNIGMQELYLTSNLYKDDCIAGIILRRIRNQRDPNYIPHKEIGLLKAI